MASNIIAFHDPCASLVGDAREVALKALREGMKSLAYGTIGAAFSAATKLPGCGKLGAEDFLPVFCDAIQAELAKVDYRA